MTKNQPNKIVSALFKEYRLLKTVKDADKYDYKKEELLKIELAKITMVVGAIEVMSKASILKLVKMQSSLRFMAHHSFYIQFAKACEDLLNLND
jgi:hypothetical protein